MSLIRPALEQDALTLAPRMRRADVDEVLASSGRSPEQALIDGLRASTKAWAYEVDGVVHALFGVAPFIGDMGSPWLLASEDFTKHKRVLLRFTPEYLSRIHADYPLLCNFVDARNLPAIRFLRHAGFTLAPARPYGHAGLPFHRFTRVDPNV